MRWLAVLFLVRTVFSYPRNPDGKAVLTKIYGHVTSLSDTMHNQVTCTRWLALCVRVVFSAIKHDVVAEVQLWRG